MKRWDRACKAALVALWGTAVGHAVADDTQLLPPPLKPVNGNDWERDEPRHSVIRAAEGPKYNVNYGLMAIHNGTVHVNGRAVSSES